MAVMPDQAEGTCGRQTLPDLTGEHSALYARHGLAFEFDEDHFLKNLLDQLVLVPENRPPLLLENIALHTIPDC